jgi:protein ImuA
MGESAITLAALRRHIAGMELRQAPAGALFETGHGPLDAALGGGLAYGRLHELFAASADDAASAAGFAAMLALRALKPGAAMLWLRTDSAERRSGCFHAPGFAELGGDPDAVLLALAPDDVALLRCAADAARCAGLGVVIAECWGSPRALDLTASRRLALAAEKSGVTLLLLRIDAQATPSAADTRWRVGAAASQALEANAPGPAALEIELLRRRAGPAGMRWRVEWNRDQCAFREPALSGAVVPLPSHRPAADSEPLRRTA